jgi:D-glycero-beta-D-manno-heptose 1-phosphate adenylyltransferase
MSSPTFASKVVTLNPLASDAATLKARIAALPKPVVFTNGVFDVVVALNTDASAKRLGKGPDRPLNALADRAAVIAALGSVDVVTAFDEDTPYELIDALRPEVIVKGGDYDMAALPEGKLVLGYGGQALALVFVDGYSTTRLVNKIKASAA